MYSPSPCTNIPVHTNINIKDFYDKVYYLEIIYFIIVKIKPNGKKLIILSQLLKFPFGDSGKE